jgi:hypothetical protein
VCVCVCVCVCACTRVPVYFDTKLPSTDGSQIVIYRRGGGCDCVLCACDLVYKHIQSNTGFVETFEHTRIYTHINTHRCTKTHTHMHTHTHTHEHKINMHHTFRMEDCCVESVCVRVCM